MKTKQNRKIGIKPIIAFVNPIENRKMRRKECMEVTCGNCGGHINLYDKYCRHCGARIAERQKVMGAKKEKVPVTFFDYKKYAVRAAKELCYPQETVEKIRQAKNDDEIRRIMTIERHKRLDQIFERRNEI